MAVNLEDLIPSLKREIQTPGFDAYPDATTDDWKGHLADAFWETVLDGVISGYEESNFIVTPESGTDDLDRKFQQLVVLYAGIRILRSKVLELDTLFRAKAGSVEYETQKSAQVLKALLDELRKRREEIVDALPNANGSAIYYHDTVYARENGVSQYSLFIGS